MRVRRLAFFVVIGAMLGAVNIAAAENVTPDEFRREMVGVPLCGTPATGAFAGKMLCTVHLSDGTAVLAGAGILMRGRWEIDGGRVCRRNAEDPMDRQRCVDYEKLGPNHYRNSDGVEVCIGPCP